MKLIQRGLSLLITGAALAASPAMAQQSLGPAAPTNSEPKPVQQNATPAPKQGLSFNPDAGIVYQSGDFRVTGWGYAERAIDPNGPDYFRRFRQGAEIDLPRINDQLRIAAVYEIDLTDTNVLGINPGPAGSLNSHDFENLYLAVQNPDDPGKFRLLFGHNTSILSREDNLSSGNLATINRSLILEEHGSTNTFGPQIGAQFQKALSPKVTVQASIGDNRGGLNAQERHAAFGRAIAAKIVLTPISDDKSGRKLTAGFAVDRTTGIRDRSFTLATAIGFGPLGGVAATGTKTTGEADIAYTFPLLGHATTVEAEALYSRFSGSRSDVGGGYAMVQFSLFDAPHTGDLDLFARYDVVSLGIDTITGRATQQAVRAGVNYNLPYTNKLASLHLEYAHNTLSGPAEIITNYKPSDEFRIVLRVSLQRYLRH
ncbi:MAG: hypothetical protein J0G94_15040 [Sphingomonadales bacterium]|nr:hypothetical protein [Sphingomonas sp. SCN 67-18]MBN8831897.1 hypothetical protein [Sphingomonadales bacterium]